MQKDYPKVLIIGQTFQANNGAGITLNNLFKDWPDDKIAVAAFQKPNNEMQCRSIHSYYLIGNKEIKPHWPFSLISKTAKSCAFYNFDRNIANSSIPKKSNCLKKIYRFIGLHTYKYKTRVSQDLLDWINHFNPDLIYSALGSLELVILVKQIKEKTARKIAIHIWDDWANKIYQNTLLSPILKYLFQKHVSDLFKKADICLSISGEMSIAYKEKYKKDFTPFHNPTDLEVFSKNESAKSNTITYIGKINKDTAPCLLQLAKAIEKLNKEEQLLNFQLFTPSLKHKVAKKIQKRAYCTVFESVEHYKIPSILSKSKFLFLPLAFSRRSRQYTKLSMPTKATEYMASGSTSIVYAPPEIALSKHAKKHKWAYLIQKKELKYLIEGLKSILQNRELQKELIQNAQHLVKTQYTTAIVREKFRLTLLTKQKEETNRKTKNEK